MCKVLLASVLEGVIALLVDVIKVFIYFGLQFVGIALKLLFESAQLRFELMFGFVYFSLQLQSQFDGLFIIQYFEFPQKLPQRNYLMPLMIRFANGADQCSSLAPLLSADHGKFLVVFAAGGIL
jgi:hypothetical protein